MISKKAIQEYLAKDINDWSWVKSIPKKTLWGEFHHYESGFIFKTLPYQHQLASIFAGIFNSNFLFFLDMGTGKAQPLNSKVLTPSGWKLMGDVKVGDKVSTPDGNFSIVTGISPREKKKVYEVTFSDDSHTRCCLSHLWSVISPNDRRHYKDKLTPFRVGFFEKICSKDVSYSYGILPYKTISLEYMMRKGVKDTCGNKINFIPLTRAIEFDVVNLDISIPIPIWKVREILGYSKYYFRKLVTRGGIRNSREIFNTRNYYIKEDLEEFLSKDNGKMNQYTKQLIQRLVSTFKIDFYLLGVLLGDGGLTNNSIIFSTADSQMIEFVKSSLPIDCRLKKVKSSKYDWIIVGKGRRYINTLVYGLRHIGLMGKNSYNKEIPKNYLLSSISDRISLLQGLIDTDGYVDRRGALSYSSSSKKLASGIEFLVNSLGGIVRWSSKQPKNGALNYVLSINLPSSIIPCRLTRKLNRYLVDKKYRPARAVKSIDFVGIEEVQCLSIKAYHGNYITDDFIVTHNSHIVLNLASILKRKKKVKKVLVLVPNVISVGNWGDEIEKHSDFSWIGLTGTKEERLINLEKEVDFYLLNHAGLQVLLADKIPRGKTKFELAGYIPKIIEFAKKFDMMVIDEIHMGGFSGYNSLTFSIADELSKRIKYRYGLTGTPVGRDPMILWPQFYLIDRGKTLGPSIEFYKEVFFNEVKDYWGGYDFKFKKAMESILHKKLSNKSIRYAEEEANDLPPKVYNKIHLTFPEENYIYYRKVADGLKEVMIKGVSKALLENAFIKLRQVTAGFLDFKNEETEEKDTIIFDDNPKLDALEELLLSVSVNEKFVVFNEYTRSGDFICDRLKKLKIKHVRLYSGTKNPEKVREQFLKDPKCRGFVINSKSGGTSLNLQNSRYVIFYESPVSPLVRKQTEKRCHRTGSTKRVFYYDFVIKNSVDVRVLGFIEEGKDIFNALIEGKDVL